MVGLYHFSKFRKNDEFIFINIIAGNGPISNLILWTFMSWDVDVVRVFKHVLTHSTRKL